MENEANFLHHEPCEKCGSSDGKAVYDDGHTFCFVCEAYTKAQNIQEHHNTPQKSKFLKGEIKALPHRNLNAYTLRKFNYCVGRDLKGNVVQIANYYDNSLKLVGQKVRYPNKEFIYIGEKNTPLYGAWLFSSEKFNEVVIVEGEIDCLSVAQAFNYNKAVVSLTRGAKGSKKDIKNNYEYLNSFKKIILAYDNDSVGREAMEDSAFLFPAGKVYLCYWSAKDPNELLKTNQLQQMVNDLQNAKKFKPQGILNANEINLKALQEKLPLGLTYAYPKLQEMTYGSRGGELNIWTAGSGIGKSTLLREVAYHFLTSYKQTKIAMIFLEESFKKTAQGFIALHNNIPLSLLRYKPEVLSTEKWLKSKKELFGDERLYLYNHFGSLDKDLLLEKIRFMVVGLGITNIFLDHISIIVSGLDSANERKDIDIFMTNLRSLVEETGCNINAIVHLKRSTSKESFNDGAEVSLTDLRGSGALEQLSDVVIALERNQQSKTKQDITQIRVLKNREIGHLGKADLLKYNRTTGRLELYVKEEQEEEQEIQDVDF